MNERKSGTCMSQTVPEPTEPNKATKLWGTTLNVPHRFISLFGSVVSGTSQFDSCTT